ncbi:unnamed protein product [Meloidogyne enterolobii]|uniref:Uncharacterized protein n=1 Tax=Meloidogyne enterolobii TaxID=390850 RepID=A0ACB0Z0Q4_MELEN
MYFFAYYLRLPFYFCIPLLLYNRKQNQLLSFHLLFSLTSLLLYSLLFCVFKVK